MLGLVWFGLVCVGCNCMVVCVLVLTGAMGMMVTLECVDGTFWDVCVCVGCLCGRPPKG